MLSLVLGRRWPLAVLTALLLAASLVAVSPHPASADILCETVCLPPDDDPSLDGSPESESWMHPTTGDDFLVGTDGNDFIDALGGNDFISGLGGYDILRGGPGFDVCLGGEVNLGCEVIR